MSRTEHVISVKAEGIQQLNNSLKQMETSAQSAGASMQNAFAGTTPVLDNYGKKTGEAGKQVSTLNGYIRQQRQEQRAQNFLYREGIGLVSVFTGNNKQLSNVMVNAFGNFQAADFALSGLASSAEAAGGKYAGLANKVSGVIGPLSIAFGVIGAGIAVMENSNKATETLQNTYKQLKERVDLLGKTNTEKEIIKLTKEIENNKKTVEDLEVVWSDYVKLVVAAMGRNADQIVLIQTEINERKRLAGAIGELNDALMKNLRLQEQEELKRKKIEKASTTEATVEAEAKLWKYRFENTAIPDSAIAYGKKALSLLDELQTAKFNLLKAKVGATRGTLSTKEGMEYQFELEQMEKEREAIKQNMRIWIMYTDARNKAWSGLSKLKPAEQEKMFQPGRFSPMQTPTTLGKVNQPEFAPSDLTLDKWGKLGEEMKNGADIGFEAFKMTFDGINTGIDNMVMGMINGTESMGEAFTKMTGQILADITSMILKTAIWKGLMTLTGNFWGLFHEGGEVKKAHSGMYVNSIGQLKSDEVPIIAQTGERILSRAQTKEYNNIMRGGGISSPTVNITINAVDAQSVRSWLSKPEVNKTFAEVISNRYSKERYS